MTGSSGHELARMLIETGILSTPLPKKHEINKLGEIVEQKLSPEELDLWWNKQQIFFTSVLPFHPPGNKAINLCGDKKEVGGKFYTRPALELGKYLYPEYLPELDRLAEEIKSVKPNLVIALGNMACWALLNRTSITSIRGTTTECLLVPGVKVLPTFHPSMVLRQWSNRPIMLADLLKAKREMEFPEIRRPEREILVNPSLDDIDHYIKHCEATWDNRSSDDDLIMAIDIETKGKQITMISFSIDKQFALVIPFYDESLPGGNYWEHAFQEVKAFKYVNILLSLPFPKLFQNGMYDLQYLFRYGFRPVNCLHDTMLLHHAILPEMQKGLGFLGSIYTNEASWKLLRRVRAKELSNKAGE
jgi:hypothetical protein